MADPQGANPDPKASQTPPPVEPAKAAIDNKDLPVVEAPKLGAGETTEAGEQADVVNEPVVVEPAAAAAPVAPRSSRFALLAAVLALAAAVGSFVGSLSASGIAHFWPAVPAPKSNIADASMSQALKAEVAEFSVLKTALDSAARNSSGQFAKLAERLDRIERAQIDPNPKLAQLTEAIERLDKRAVAPAASPETTGTITPVPPPAAEAKQPDRILQDWIVEDVRGSRALVESRYGGIFTVTSGSTLPGLGHVEAIKRQDGQWVVVTERGLITSGH